MMVNKMKKLVEYWTAEEVKDKIAIKYKAPAWITFTEVRDGTGFVSAGKTADAMTFGVWPSRGLSIIGFEVKVHRSDWLSELKKPEKAESMAKHCNAWYVVSQEGVIKKEEVPANWGFYVVTRRGLKLVKEAPYDLKMTGPINRTFIMSVIRNFSRSHVPKAKVEELVKKGIEDHKEAWGWEAKRAKEDYQELREKVDKFEKAAGFSLGTWGATPEHLGKLIKYLTSYEFKSDYKNAVKSAATLARALKTIGSIELFKWIDEKLKEEK